MQDEPIEPSNPLTINLHSFDALNGHIVPHFKLCDLIGGYCISSYEMICFIF